MNTKDKIAKLEARIATLRERQATLENEAEQLGAAARERQARIARAVRDGEPTDSVATEASELRALKDARPHREEAAKLVAQEIVPLEAELEELRVQALRETLEAKEAEVAAALNKLGERIGAAKSEILSQATAAKRLHEEATALAAQTGVKPWQYSRNRNNPHMHAAQVVLNALEGYSGIARTETAQQAAA